MTPRRDRGFTLLEAVLALAMLSGVLSVCLTLRAQSMSHAQRLERRHSADLGAQAIFDLAAAGLLGPPTVDEETGARTWRGEHLGRPYVVHAQRRVRANPLAATAALGTVASSVRVWIYRVDYAERPTEFLWYR